MSYIIEVYCRHRDEKHPSWKALKASHSKEPFRYETEEEAQQIRRMCYPDLGNSYVRVRKEDA